MSILYIILDPFKVVRKYSYYYISDEITGVSLNRGYVSTSVFDNQNKEYKYNSFIFGNSRSIFYEIDDWKQYLQENCSCFHFDASGESLYGIYKKIQYLFKRKVPLVNALIILDYDTLVQIRSNKGHLFIIAPQLEENKNLAQFHQISFNAFLNPYFIFAYLDYTFSKKVKTYMKKNSFLDDRPLHYNAKTNEISYPYFEKLIAEGRYYTPDRMKVFTPRQFIGQQYSPIAIEDQQKIMLSDIKTIFQNQNTHYRIIINPLYDQLKLNVQDLIYLENLFGKENVFDFSGINEITNDYTNYYENSHYRPHIAYNIMQKIYTNISGE
jgi:hypothetical protein